MASTTPHDDPDVPFALGATADATYQSFMAGAAADPSVAGLVLCGSQACAGMQTERSDYDVHIIVEDGRQGPFSRLDGFRSRDLDLVVLSVSEFRVRGLPDDPQNWDPYGYAHGRLLFDRTDGVLAELLEQKRRLDPDYARGAADGYLDAYVNMMYRSMKSHRDQRAAEAHIDAAESIPFAISAIFALHQRPKPYNKYLAWELREYPLGEEQWRADRLLPLIRRILADGAPAAQRALFSDVERAARQSGHGEVLDSWETELELLRGAG